MTARNAIAVMCDAKLFPAAVFLCDRLSALNNRDDTDIFLFTESAMDIAIAREFGVSFQLREFSPAEVAGFPSHGYLSEAAYYWFFLPGLLGKEYRRALYLDVDLYPENDRLFAVFDLDLKGRAVAAVRALRHHQGTGETRAVMRKGGTKYLNSGVMLFDNDAFARMRLLERLLGAVRAKAVPMALWDQSALNYVLDGDWLELSQSFNMLSGTWLTPVRYAFEPVIVHFAGPIKPWHGEYFRMGHPVRKELEAFIAASPWKGFTASEVPLMPKRDTQKEALQAVVRALDHLMHDRFADVEQGITVRHMQFLLQLSATFAPGRPVLPLK